MATTKAPARRKKPLKDQLIPVRVTVDQKRILTDAATEAGLGVSSWLVMLGLKAAHDRRQG